jgi:hypothetical protein
LVFLSLQIQKRFAMLGGCGLESLTRMLMVILLISPNLKRHVVFCFRQRLSLPR